MKKTKYKSLVLMILSLIFIVTSCTNDSILESEELNTKSKNLTSKTYVENDQNIYFLTENDLLLCSPTLNSSSVYNKTIPNNYPIITGSKWYASTPPNDPNASKDSWYFSTLRENITNFYNINSNNVEFSTYSIDSFEIDASISKATVYIYPSQYYNFIPGNYINNTLAIDVMHAIFTQIDNFSTSYGKPLVGATIYINSTMCGGYAGLGVRLYFGN